MAKRRKADDYIKRKDAIFYAQWEGAYKAVINIEELPAADVQPLSVVAEHIKNRLYETALNTSEAVARDAIADMAERIDFWIDELKGGDTK